MAEHTEGGRYFMQGNDACAEGALAAGCRFFAGYPITPATEITERMAERLPEVGGLYIQMEDEIASISAVIGASWTGAKTMTASSGPGISLMQENIGYAVGTETPCVLVNVQRGGPTTGIPAVSFQGDVVQARRGSHGEYESIAFAPASPQEMFDLTVHAFNTAERFRTPVILLADAFVGHMREEVRVPPSEELELVDRKLPPATDDPSTLRGFLDPNVAPMPVFGRQLRAHVTGSCHNEYGQRNVVDAEALDNFVRRLTEKIQTHRDEIVRTESYRLDDAEIALVAYGTVSRAAITAADLARERGLKVGVLRLISIWPFAEREIVDLADAVPRIVVLENNLGQLFPYIRAAAAGHADVTFLPPKVLGTMHNPRRVVEHLAAKKPAEGQRGRGAGGKRL